jgi:hypothetical protein
MRALVSIALFIAGVSAAGAVWLRSSGALHPRDPHSLVERLAVLRLQRATSPAPEGSLSVQGELTRLRLEGASGATEIACENGAQLSRALGRSGDASARCTEQAIDESADVIFYDVGGRAPALCPAQWDGATEEQLQHALYLPALAPEGAPAGALTSGGFSSCNGDDSSCALTSAPGVAIVCGVVRSCAEGACAQGAREDLSPEDIAASFLYEQALARDGRGAAPDCAGTVHAQPAPFLSEVITAATAAPFAEDEPWALRGLASPGSAATAAGLRRYFAQKPRGVCFLVKGLELERTQDADRVARALAFPVFSAADPQTQGRATPIARALQAAANSDAKLKALLPACELDEQDCAKKRERAATILRAWLSGLKPPISSAGAESIAAHIAMSGPFRFASRGPFHLELRSAPLKSGPASAMLTVRQQLLAPELLHGAVLRCEGPHKLCVYRGLPSAVTVHPASQGAAAQDPWVLAWMAADRSERAGPRDVAERR